MQGSEPSAPPTTFEEAFERLRATIEELETGPLPLETAITRYEDGMRLAQVCNEILDGAELRIQHVLREADGEAGSA
ncbi:MAG: exodeoxyribonuclease small subunit [Chloroflexota bacterium]|jgi:exodeoxyribonuclease VII small subunit|nr:exodeoxyribonuclease small subunit [Chloroflexota bacterium]